MGSIEVVTNVELTPERLAAAFWNMNSSQQADFYAALHVVSEGMLCQQTAYIVDEIVQRDIAGRPSAKEAFRTLHSHADAYIEAQAWRMGYEATKAIAGIAAQVTP